MNGSALIVEDHPLYRDALINLLRPVLGDCEISSASSAEEGLKLGGSIHDLRLIMIDPGLPRMSGVEAIRTFCQTFPAALVIVVSASDDRREAEAALRAGALAFVSKAVHADLLTGVVADALAGKVQTVRWITPHGDQAVTPDGALSLTPRQHEILMLLCNGHSNKEIGLRLNIAEITVKVHVSSIFRTLEVANRTQAVLAARRLGLYAVG